MRRKVDVEKASHNAFPSTTCSNNFITELRKLFRFDEFTGDTKVVVQRVRAFNTRDTKIAVLRWLYPHNVSGMNLCVLKARHDRCVGENKPAITQLLNENCFRSG